MAPTNNNTTWTAPRTWTVGELVTASIMNTHVRDNLTALHVPAGGYNYLNLGADITTTSTSFVDVDATNCALTFTTGGGDVLFGFVGSLITAIQYYFDVYESVAAARIGGDDGIFRTGSATANLNFPCSFVIRIPSLSAAAHTFTLQWKVASGTGTLYAGAGTGSNDLHAHIWAFEI